MTSLIKFDNVKASSLFPTKVDQKITIKNVATYDVKEDTQYRTVKYIENGKETTIIYDKINQTLVTSNEPTKVIELKNVIKTDYQIKNQKALIPSTSGNGIHIESDPDDKGVWKLVSTTNVNSPADSFKYAYERRQNTKTGIYGWSIERRNTWKPFVFECSSNKSDYFRWKTAVNHLYYTHVALVACVSTSALSSILTLIAAATAIGGIVVAAGFGSVAAEKAVSVFTARSDCDDIYEECFE